jgi:hypothetical protein
MIVVFFWNLFIIWLYRTLLLLTVALEKQTCKEEPEPNAFGKVIWKS